MPLIGSLILFVIFAVNVALGSSGGTTFLNDVGEFLVLAATAILFVVGILQKEAAAKSAAQHGPSGGHSIDE
ncbi:MAG: hypothetical protein ACSHWS_16620 [Sulfitobacter sp.]